MVTRRQRLTLGSSVPVMKHLTLLNRSSRIFRFSRALVAVAVADVAAAAVAEVTPEEVLATESFAGPLSSFTLIVLGGSAATVMAHVGQQ